MCSPVDRHVAGQQPALRAVRRVLVDEAETTLRGHLTKPSVERYGPAGALLIGAATRESVIEVWVVESSWRHDRKDNGVREAAGLQHVGNGRGVVLDEIVDDRGNFSRGGHLIRKVRAYVDLAESKSRSVRLLKRLPVKIEQSCSFTTDAVHRPRSQMTRLYADDRMMQGEMAVAKKEEALKPTTA